MSHPSTRFTPVLLCAILVLWMLLPSSGAALADGEQKGAVSTKSEPDSASGVELKNPPSGAVKYKRGDLVRAVIGGNEQEVRTLLRQGADPNENVGTDDSPITPLFAAVALDDEKIGRVILALALKLDLSRTYSGYDALDFATYWEQESLQSRLASELGELSAAETQVSSAFDRDRATYVANGLAALSESNDPGVAIGLIYIATAFRQAGDSRLDGDKILKQANRLREEGQKKAKDAGVKSLAVDQAVVVALQTIEDKRVAQQVAEQMLSAGGRAVDLSSIAIQFGMIRSAAQHELSTNGLNQKALEATFLVGARNQNNSTSVINSFASTTLNANVNDTADVIVSRNPLRFNSAVFELVRSSTAPAPDAIANAWGQVVQSIRATNAAHIQALKAGGDKPSAQPKAAERDQGFAAYQSSLYLIQALASVSDPKQAKAFVAVGNATLQLGKALAEFEQATFVEQSAKDSSRVTSSIASMNVIGALISVVMVVAAASDDAVSPQKVILDQIVELRKQVEDVQREMEARFNAVDHRLDQIFKVLVTGFQSLTLDVAFARDELRTAAIQISLLENNLLDLEPNVRSYIDAAADRPLWKQVNRCLDWKSNESATRLAYKDFSDALDALQQAATREAADILAVGTRLTDPELADDSKLASRFLALTDQGLDSNIGLMQSISHRFMPENGFSQANLANPMRWAVMVEAYAQLAFQYPHYFKQRTTKGVDDMLQVGVQWREALKELRTGESHDASTDRVTLYQRLLENYSDKPKLLRQAVGNLVTKYELENVDGYDLWAGVQQDLRPGVKLISFSASDMSPSDNLVRDWDTIGVVDRGNYHLSGVRNWKGSKVLAVPVELADFKSAATVIDKPMLMAHHVGLGKIDVRWDAPGWDESKGHYANSRSRSVTGKCALSVVGTFKGKDSQRTFNLFNRRVNSGEEIGYWSGIRFGIHTRDLADEIQAKWPSMRQHVFQGPDSVAAGEKAEAVSTATKLIVDFFSDSQKRLESGLWVDAHKADGQLIDAFRQLTAGKAIIDAFVSLGMAKSLSENADLRDLLFGENTAKGKTRLLDLIGVEMVASHGGSMLEVARDAEWLDGPAKRLDALFKSLPESPEPHPLIETTMDRLNLLRRMLESARPAKSLSQAAKDLKTKVQALSQQPG